MRGHLTGEALEVGSRTVDHGASLPSLSLSSSTIPELGAQGQELSGCGGSFSRR